jgi:hypothetical protein
VSQLITLYLTSLYTFMAKLAPARRFPASVAALQAPPQM